jgi:hypothetical protein
MKRALAFCAVLVVGGPLAGLVGCTAPAAALLPCIASASPTNPSDNTNDTITVRSVSGAKVLAVAAYKTTNTARSAVTNALGVGRAVFPIGRATYGYQVKVSVLVAKGSQKGSCATSFTPRPVAASIKPTNLSTYNSVVQLYATLKCRPDYALQINNIVIKQTNALGALKNPMFSSADPPNSPDTPNPADCSKDTNFYDFGQIGSTETEWLKSGPATVSFDATVFPKNGSPTGPGAVHFIGRSSFNVCTYPEYQLGHCFNTIRT